VIDNIFINNSKLENYTAEPLIQGLSDHEAQLIEINYIDLQCGSQQYQTVRKIDKYTVADFVTKFSYETWDAVFDSSDTDSKFNCFLNTHLRIFYLSFPLMRVKNSTKNKTWVTVFSHNIYYHFSYLLLTTQINSN